MRDHNLDNSHQQPPNGHLKKPNPRNTHTNTNTTRHCKYGTQCRHVGCKFQHPVTATTTTTSPSSTATTSPQRQQQRQFHVAAEAAGGERRRLCRYGSKCRNMASGCQFQHRSSKDGLNMDSYYGWLEAAEAKGYRAAGILVVRQRPVACFEAAATMTPSHHHLQVQVLCCAEIRKKTKNQSTGPLQLSLLGGKIEDSDDQDSRVTAAREFWEETGGIVPLEECQRLVGLSSQNAMVEMLPIWCAHAKYVLYVALEKNPTRQHQWNELPVNHSEALRSGKPLPKDAEANHLVWVDWNLIKEKLQKRNTGSPQKHNISSDDAISFFVPSNGGLSERVVVPFSIHAKFTFANPTVQEGIDTIIQKLLKLDISKESHQSTPAGDEIMEETVKQIEKLSLLPEQC